jgi:hypothetical protein
MLIERRTATDRALIEAPEAAIGHAAVNGAIVGFVFVLTIVSGIALAAGAGLGSALGVGAFAALWGGPGWGGWSAPCAAPTGSPTTNGAPPTAEPKKHPNVG